MIQRIQTLWLILAAVCIIVCFFTPAATYTFTVDATGQTVEAEMNLIGKDNPEMFAQISSLDPIVEMSQKDSGFHTWPLLLAAILTVAAALTAIFLYKNRTVQMRVAAIGCLLAIAYVMLLFFWAVDGYQTVVENYMHCHIEEARWGIGTYAPLGCIVFFVLAHYGIKKDDNLVRSADRLRR